MTSAARARGFAAPNDPFDMAQTVRDKQVETKYDETGKELATVTTIFMQDGSKHVRTADKEPYFDDRSPAITETSYDKNGKMVSETSSVTFKEYAGYGMAGANCTDVRTADGTLISIIGWPNGTVETTVHTPDGRQADVPLNILNHPILMAEGAAISGLQAQAERGIPKLTEEAVEKVRIGAKYGGPALAVAGALWDVAVAKTGFEKCVASVEGVTSVTAGVIAGVATTPGTPALAVPVSIVAGIGGQALGNWIGNTFCPR